MKKLVGFLLFQHQFLRALVHNVLEVVGVTLELLDHRVHYVDLPDMNERAELNTAVRTSLQPSAEPKFLSVNLRKFKKNNFIAQ